ncbi:tetraspanin-19-like [Dendrobium catenatum]|uniref:tetraspanin-19-like n=1 Tax=Dendrobium catenatum TaxID=906689 RepID=UPI0009F669E4|nr:tetraspanin-19-like [Dendrobium catenatum]
MLRFVRSCLQFLLKLVNSVIGLMGMGMTLYSLWMLRVWYKQVHSFWTSGPDSTLPWFIYTCLGLGVYFCIISCAGHISAETANGCCLSSYIVFVLLLVMMEAAISADVLLNKVWEKDFPEDPTGRFDELKKFVISNYELCKWIALVVVSAQALSIFLAILLKSVGPYRGNYYDSDDDYIPARLPLLRNQVKHSPYICAAHPSLKNDYWNVRLPKS